MNENNALSKDLELFSLNLMLNSNQEFESRKTKTNWNSKKY